MNARQAVLVCSLAAAFLSVVAHAQVSSPEPVPDQFTVKGGEYRLFARAFRGKDATDAPVLVVVLHGDAPHDNPGYQYRVATRIAAACPDVIVAALLRPGYTDAQGNHSEGERGLTVGDNWNAKDTDATADAIGELRRRFHARRVVVAGHSGGACITANILGRHPEIIDAALLVSCPCDVEPWRASMFKLTGNAAFQGKIDTLSPLELVGNLSPKVPVTMLVGTADDVAPPALSKAYSDAAQKAGKQVKLIELPGKGQRDLRGASSSRTGGATREGVTPCHDGGRVVEERGLHFCIATPAYALPIDEPRSIQVIGNTCRTFSRQCSCPPGNRPLILLRHRTGDGEAGFWIRKSASGKGYVLKGVESPPWQLRLCAVSGSRRTWASTIESLLKASPAGCIRARSKGGPNAAASGRAWMTAKPYAAAATRAAPA